MAAKPKSTPKVPEAEAKAPTNGEYQAEQAEKAKALAEAEAAKAEAEAKAAKAKANEETLQNVLRPELQAAGENLEAAQTSLGNVLRRAEAYLPSVSFATVQAFAEEVIPEHCGPIWTSSPAYRSLQAARVAFDIGPSVGSTSVDALTWLHRFTPEQRVQVFKRAKGRSTRPSVTKARIQEVGRELFPEQAEAKKGPKPGTAQAAKGATTKAAKAKAEQAEKAAVQEVLDAIGAVRPDEEAEPTGPIVKEALAAIGKALQAHVDEYGGDAYSAGLSMFTVAVELCDKWTVPVVRAALKFRAEADEKKAAEAPTTKAPRKRTTKANA